MIKNDYKSCKFSQILYQFQQNLAETKRKYGYFFLSSLLKSLFFARNSWSMTRVDRQFVVSMLLFLIGCGPVKVQLVAHEHVNLVSERKLLNLH